MTTKQRHDTHATPRTLAAWHHLAAKALKVDPGMIRRLGPVKEGKEGVYAARRVWFLRTQGTLPDQDPFLASAEIVASDEANGAAPQVEADGRTWWTWAHHGHYGYCGPDCERHGDAWEGGL